MLLRILSIVSLIILAFLTLQASAETLSGCVNKEHIVAGSGVIVNGKTGFPVEGAVVSIPAKNISTITNKRGEFNLNVPSPEDMILSIKKPGFKPYSVALGKPDLSKPMRIGIMERGRNEYVIDSSLHHLGDNKFSEKSANAEDFSSGAAGPYYIQEFYLDNIDVAENIVLKIGSIIGIDTRAAQCMKQSGVRSSSSTPVRVYLNSQQVGAISVNGDNHELSVPANLLKANKYNIVKIETGINTNSDDGVDYDDIEFMNLILNIGES